MWTTEYEADIASDLSAFHRIDDPMTIDGPRYFSLAARLAAYSGVLAARAAKLHEDERKGASGAHSPAHGGAVARSTPEQPSRISDDAALAMLALDGWAEHEKEEGTE